MNLEFIQADFTLKRRHVLNIFCRLVSIQFIHFFPRGLLPVDFIPKNSGLL